MSASTLPALTRPVRVLHIVSCLGLNGRTGGTEYGIIKLVNGLDPAQVASTVCSTIDADPAFVGLLNDGVGYFQCGKREGNDWRLVPRLCGVIRAARPAIVHTHAWGTLVEGLLAARVCRVPVLIHGEHGTLQTKPYQLRLQRWAWGRVTQVLSVSSRLADTLAGTVGFPRERIAVIRNGVDLTRFGPRLREEGRAALGVSTTEVAVGTVGRLVPVKDQALFLRAVAVVAREGLAFRAFIAGEGPLRAELSSLVDQLGLSGRVTWLGHRADVERVMAGLDVFVLSSRSEGLSNTIQEALCSGVPVVATRVGGADELVDDGRSGFLVPPGDAEAMGRALVALVGDRDRRHAFAAAAAERATREFGFETMSRGYRDLYLTLAGQLR
jgi:sugar transferase (PEP-CTERM/EpsH1 system associated)